jgi:hypothetical protein
MQQPAVDAFFAEHVQQVIHLTAYPLVMSALLSRLPGSASRTPRDAEALLLTGFCYVSLKAAGSLIRAV